MAYHFARQISCLLLIVSLFSPYIDAREGKFFLTPSPAPAPVISEIIHPPAGMETGVAPAPVESDTVYAPTPSPASAPVISGISNPPVGLENGIVPVPVESDNAYGPTPSPASAPVVGETSHAPAGLENGIAPAPAQIDNAYGLYGRPGADDDEFLPKRTTATTARTNIKDENEAPAEEFNTGSFMESNTGEYSYNNYNNNYENKRFSTSNYNENGYLPSNYNNKAYTDNYNENFVQREGMSDTRFMENGKYYYDINKEYNNYNQNGYESAMRSGNNGGYYGENTNYEFDSMEEYEKRQGYPDTQREYVP